ncbi:MAG: S8 family serine peptidase [Hyphomonadaceae bacterium]
MRHRASRLALALAPILVLAACDQIASLWEGVRQQAETAQQQGEEAGPAALDSVPLEARALAGVVRPAVEAAALIQPEPVMIAPGEIVVGAPVEEEIVSSAESLQTELGIDRSTIASLRTGLRARRNSEVALQEFPDHIRRRVRARAESQASGAAREEARRVLGRLGVDGEVNVRPGGVVTVNLRRNRRVSPTALPLAQQAQTEAAAPGANAPVTTGDLPTTPDGAAPSELQAVRWTGQPCPRIVSPEELEQDLELATRCAVARLEASGQFEYVDPNFIATIDFDRLPGVRPSTPPPTQPTPSNPTPAQPAEPATMLPNDPLEALQWHYRARGAAAGQSPGGAGFEAFWVGARQVGSRGIRVAVVDTGLDTRHPEIAGSPNVAAGVDLIANTERAGDGDGPDADAFDVGDRCGTATENSYHGTHVAGTIGAVRTNNRVGIAGAAWNVTVVPVRVLGRCGGELADIASGIRWAAGLAPAVLPDGRQLANGNPADIINLSLSVGVPCPASMQSAIDAAVARGAVIVVAAGNKSGQTRNYAPANCNNVIVVGANDERGNLSFYSNFGPEVDILAPGGDVFADRDGDGRPDGVLSARTATTGCYDPANNAAAAQTCNYTFLQGTSMAAPHVSAALALLASQTGLRGRELENALFTRALGPIDPAQCRIECARNSAASPIPGNATMCMRACGRGMLDMARAATAPPITQPAAAAQRRRR